MKNVKFHETTNEYSITEWDGSRVNWMRLIPKGPSVWSVNSRILEYDHPIKEWWLNYDGDDGRETVTHDAVDVASRLSISLQDHGGVVIDNAVPRQRDPEGYPDYMSEANLTACQRRLVDK